MKRICVFCGSNGGTRPVYRETAVQVGRILVRRRIGLVYGGARVGLMGTLADTVLEAGGAVTGVMPEGLVAREVAHRRLPDLRVVGSMHERKALMSELSDAFLTLPGGYGTLDELFEALSWSQLAIHRKACGVLNIDGFYDPLLQMLDHAVVERFLKPEHRSLLLSDTDPDRLISALLEARVPETSKWVDRDPRLAASLG